MKTTAKMIAIIFLLGTGMWLTPQKAQAHYGITYQVFYDDLSPYGDWVYTPDYGYVWVPETGPGFMPYNTDGYWTYSVYGWTWVSYYPWGWAPFHYGRWYYDNWYGWAWVPGTEWGPGWVAWSQCDGYYGWAPLTPHVDINISFNVNILPPFAWVFVPRTHFGYPHMDRYYVNRYDNDRYLRRSTFIAGTGTDRETNVRYYSGPSVREVSKVTGREIRPVEVRSDSRPGQAVSGREMKIYRPEVRKSEIRSDARPAPKSYSNYNDRKVNNSTPVVKNTAPVENTRKQYSTPPRQEPSKNIENRTPRQEPVNRKEYSTPQQERKSTPPQYQKSGNTDRKPMPPVKQNTVNERKAAPAPTQKAAPQNNNPKGKSEGHSRH